MTMIKHIIDEILALKPEARLRTYTCSINNKTITQALKGRFKFPHSFKADLIKSNKKDLKR